MPVPALNGYLFTSAEVVRRTPFGYTSVTLSFRIPNNPKLLGVVVYMQVYSEGYLNLPVPASYKGLSQGLRAVIGK